MLKLHKMTGAGNSFLVLEDNSFPEAKKRRSFVKKLCSLNYGVGADGLLFIKRDQKQNQYIWDFYNSDGSSAEMCGNAARCAALYVEKIMGAPAQEEAVFVTVAGIVKAHVLNETTIQVLMPQTHDLGSLTIAFDGKDLSVQTYNTGVPHAVVVVGSLADLNIYKDIIRQLRHHPHFGAAGANVTFVERLSSLQIKAVTFERGVEDFTLACGTGAVAAAAAEMKTAKAEEGSQVSVEMPGGKLNIHFPNKAQPLMSGEAHFICEISVYEEVFNESV